MSVQVNSFNSFATKIVNCDGNHGLTMTLVLAICLVCAGKMITIQLATTQLSTTQLPAFVLPITHLARTQLLRIQLDMSTMHTTRLARTQLASTLLDTTNPPHVTHQKGVSVVFGVGSSPLSELHVL